MDHNIDIGELQRTIGKYVEQYNLVVAAGPMAAAGVLKMVTGKSKVVNMAVVGAGAWFAVQEISTPMLRLITDQFGYLQSIFQSFRG